MKKKFGVILTLACIGAACFAAGCSQQTKLEKYQKKGYTIMVTYDANGGSFLGRQGITVMDLFKPSDYDKDANGEVHISLKEPTDLSRPTSGTGSITLTKQEHFFAGWYQNKELRKNDAGQVVSEAGAVLEEIEGTYVYAGTEEEATPAYTYSGHWNFEEDTIDYKESDGLYQMTLYAAWVPYYQFDYYYQVEGESDWTYVSSSTFDYKTTNATGSTTADYDTIWVPAWQEGAMNYEYKYANTSNYKFPKVEDTTFIAAYTDKACTEKIETSFEHQGTLDLEKGIAVNRVQDIYIKLEKGERFEVDSAEKFSKYAKNLNGIYEITADLDFKNGEVKWPEIFVSNEFNGKIYSKGGTYSIKNVLAEYKSDSAQQGGLFGALSGTATVKDVKFENVTVDFVSASTNSSDAVFGTFAGDIADTATVSNVTITDATLRLGKISLQSAFLNLLTNGKTDGITRTNKIKLQVYGEKQSSGKYQYSFIPDNVSVNSESLSITIDYSGKRKDKLLEFASKDVIY